LIEIVHKMKLLVLTLVILAANAGGGTPPAPPTTTTTTKAPEKGMCKGKSVDKAKCAAHNNDKDACEADMKVVMFTGKKQRCEWLPGDFVDQGCADANGASCAAFLKDCPKPGNNVVDNEAGAQWYLDNCMQSCGLCGETVTFTVGSGCDKCEPPAPSCKFNDYVTYVPGSPACVNNKCVFTKQTEACGEARCTSHGCEATSGQRESVYLVYPKAEHFSIAVKGLAMVGVFAAIYGTYQAGKSMMA